MSRIWIAFLLTLIVCLTSVHLPCSAEKEKEEVPMEISADYLKYYWSKKEGFAQGNIEVRYKDWTISADKLYLNFETKEADLEGNITLSAEAQKVRGDRLKFNYETKEWGFKKGEATLEPEFFKGDVISPLFFSGEDLKGNPERVDVSRGGMTTCELSKPHYSIDGQRIVVMPDKKLIAKDVTFWVGKTRLFTLPHFETPLRDIKRQQFAPEVGESEPEGKYLKAIYNYSLTDLSYGTLRLDLLERKGIGKGLEHTYSILGGRGNLYAYHILDRITGLEELTARWTHQQPLLWGIQSSLSLDYRRNSYYYLAGMETLYSELSLSKSAPNFDSNLSMRLSQTRGLTTSADLSSNFRHSYNITKDFSLLVSSDYTASRYSLEEPVNEELYAKFRLRKTGEPCDYELRTERRLDLDEERYPYDKYYPVTEKMPELVVETNFYRLKSLKLGKIPAKLQLSLGRFHEEPNNITLDRGFFQLDFHGSRLELGKTTFLDLNGFFNQGFYSDDTAQYVFNGNASLKHNFTKEFYTDLNYYYQKPEGYTPFRFDYFGLYNSITYGLTYQKDKKFTLKVTSGQDFQTNYYQDAILRLRYTPSDRFLLSLSMGYDRNNFRFRDLIGSLRISTEPFKLDLGTRYNVERKELRRLNLSLDWQITPQWRLQALAGYNGYTRAVDYQDIMLIRDLHCWQAVFLYSQERREFRVDLFIKAFPTRERAFGIGRFGQSFDTSVGEWY